MGDFYNHNKCAWEKRKIQIPPDVKCLCWLSENKCQFQRHMGPFVFCEDPEIFQLCLNNEDFNCGDGG